MELSWCSLMVALSEMAYSLSILFMALQSLKNFASVVLVQSQSICISFVSPSLLYLVIASALHNEPSIILHIGYLSKSINGQKDGGDNLCTPAIAVLSKGGSDDWLYTLAVIRGLNYIHIEAVKVEL